MKHEKDKLNNSEILIVDDAQPNRMLLTLWLQKMGKHVTMACNGSEAVEKASHNIYDLIFMDMQMPVMNGIEAVKELRKRHINTPVIATTGNVMQEDIDKAFEAGCIGYLKKPFDRRSLKTIIDKYVPHVEGQYSDKIDALRQQTELLDELCCCQRPSLPEQLVDIDKAMKYCGDEAAILRIAKSVLTDGSECIEKIESAIKNEKPEELLIAAHRLRGICLLIGASQVAESSGELENKAAARTVENSIELLDQLRDHFDRLVELISQNHWLEKVRATEKV